MDTRRRLATLGAALALLATGACSTGDPDLSKAVRPTKITSMGLLVQDMSNPFFSAMTKGARQAAERIGARLNIQDAQLDLGTQTNQIDAFIQQKVDLIVISAVDEKGIEPALIRARAAGVIVIAVDTPARGADAVVMTDAVQAGEKSCRYLFEQIGGKGNVLLVDGTPIKTIIDRIKGCENALKDFPGVKVVGHQSSKNDRASGLAVTTDMLTAAPSVQGIFGMNDPSALGAVLAVQQAHRTGIKVTGVDGSPDGIAEIERPGSPYIATATQNPAEMVRRGVTIAEDIIAGRPPAEHTILVPSELIDRDNVARYPGW